MNMELLEKVAQWLEAGAPHEVTGGMGFDMHFLGNIVEDVYDRMPEPDWLNSSCGTVGCIAGAINQFSGNKVTESDEWTAMIALGVDAEREYELSSKLYTLFYPTEIEVDEDEEFDYSQCWYASPQQAAKVVRHFMTTGEVDWKKAFEV